MEEQQPVDGNNLEARPLGKARRDGEPEVAAVREPDQAGRDAEVRPSFATWTGASAW